VTVSWQLAKWQTHRSAVDSADELFTALAAEVYGCSNARCVGVTSGSPRVTTIIASTVRLDIMLLQSSWSYTRGQTLLRMAGMVTCGRQWCDLQLHRWRLRQACYNSTYTTVTLITTLAHSLRNGCRKVMHGSVACCSVTLLLYGVTAALMNPTPCMRLQQHQNMVYKTGGCCLSSP
jgi:hypothetical protein